MVSTVAGGGARPSRAGGGGAAAPGESPALVAEDGEAVAKGTTPVTPPDAQAVDELIADDWARLGDSQRRMVRYATIGHLAKSDGVDLDVVRFGMEKALNGVSTAPRIVRMQALDPAATVFRIDGAAYGWRDADWQRIEGSEHAAANIRASGGAKVMKGDWLVFATTRPEVYDRLLRLPPLESMLESRLGVDRSQAQYMGVATSIVTFAGRIMERIPIRHGEDEGYYWRSYDFISDAAAGRALAKADPTYANGRSVAQLIAGEFIFSLPNGLQAYMLSGFGAQHRFDALANVARDPRREDKLVINGESCITCHANGLNTRKDEVRPAFMARSSLSESERQRLQTLYPEQARIDELFAKDNARYAAAIARLGYPDVKREPIGATVDAFKRDRGLRDFRKQRGETDAVFGGN